MNTVSDFKAFTDWVKEKDVKQTKNPEQNEEMDLSKSLVEKAVTRGKK